MGILKKFYLATIAMLTLYGCIDDVILEGPTMTITPGADSVMTFSWRHAATYNITLTCNEDIDSMKIYSVGGRGHTLSREFTLDTVFEAHTHRASFEFKCKIGEGWEIPSDSTYMINFESYAAGIKSETTRKLRYKMSYPKTDTFDITVNKPGPGDKYFLIDIEGKSVYGWNGGMSNNFDLVFVHSSEKGNSFWGFVSPDADTWLNQYFYKISNNMIYDVSYVSKPRQTAMGLIEHNKNQDYYSSWQGLTDQLVEEETMVTSIINGTDFFGIGIDPLSPLQGADVIKCRLYNGRYALIYIDECFNTAYDDCYVKLKIKYQIE